MTSKNSVSAFNFEEGLLVAGKYRISRKLGGGWEGEVYLVEEQSTGIERVAKFFYPKRNIRNKTAKFYAKKLHNLRDCNMVVQYLTQDILLYGETDVTYLISEYVEGETLEKFLKEKKGKRLAPFQALHLLYSLSKGIEQIHNRREYHGDLHSANILVLKYGLGFDLKLYDMFHWGDSPYENMRDDIVNMIKIFYEALGGQKHYHKHPKEIKEICCGLKRSLILKKFKTAARLTSYLEEFHWENCD